MAKKKRVKSKANRKTKARGFNFKVFLAEQKTKLAVKNIGLFIILALASFVASKLVQAKLLVNLFSVMAISFAFISIGFGIVFLVLLIIKSMRR